MTGREKYLSIVAVVLVILLGASLVVNEKLGRKFNEFDQRIEELRQQNSSIKESLVVIEPYSGQELQTDEDVFNISMSRFEHEALLGDWPAGQTFEEAILPHLYKFYVASSLGFMDRELAFSYVLRTRQFVASWPVTFSTAKYTVDALYYQLMHEINHPPTDNKPSDKQT